MSETRWPLSGDVLQSSNAWTWWIKSMSPTGGTSVSALAWQSADGGGARHRSTVEPLSPREALVGADGVGVEPVVGVVVVAVFGELAA